MTFESWVRRLAAVADEPADVEGKIKTLDDLSQFVVEQSSITRGQFLELTIVLILVFELVLIVLGVMQRGGLPEEWSPPDAQARCPRHA